MLLSGHHQQNPVLYELERHLYAVYEGARGAAKILFSRNYAQRDENPYTGMMYVCRAAGKCAVIGATSLALGSLITLDLMLAQDVSTALGFTP